MKKALSLLFSLPLVISYLVLLLFLFTQPGCADTGNKKFSSDSGALSVAQPDANDYWLTLNIRFKPNVDNNIREICIKTIENYLVDTIADIKLKNTNLNSYKPSVALTKYPFEDSISYQFKITKGSDPVFSLIKIDTTVGPSGQCKCPTCGVCRAIQSLTITPGMAQYGGTPLSDYIDSIATP